MNKFMVLNDDYILGLTEQGREPEVVSFCYHCGNELYEGEEVVADETHHFCDLECANEEAGFKYKTLEREEY